MQQPTHITFTGVDERTDLSELNAISALYPVEWGVLFSRQRQGAEPRYPGLDFANIFQLSRLEEMRTSAHLCGELARTALLDPRNRRVLDIVRDYERVQLNFVGNSPHLASELVESHSGLPLGYAEAKEFAQVSGKQVIVQHRTLKFPRDKSLHYLFDKSGGKGKVPVNWPTQEETYGLCVGYAGGLSPENIRYELERMGAEGEYWIDMESGVRTDDWFDLAKVRRVCEIVFED